MHLTFGRSVKELLVNDDDKQGCAPMILASDCSGLRWVEIVDLECLPLSGTRNGSRLGCRFVVRILAVTRKGQRLDEARSARSDQPQQAHVFVRNTAPWHQLHSRQLRLDRFSICREYTKFHLISCEACRMQVMLSICASFGHQRWGRRSTGKTTSEQSTSR